MVIDHYEYEAQAQLQLTNPIVYIVYIKDGDKILQIDNATSSRRMISGKTITIPQQDISTIIIDLDRYKVNKTYERIKAGENIINNTITINIKE
jgi:ASC-1-like (ASCH) protein